jgi:hypothetical protein
MYCKDDCFYSEIDELVEQSIEGFNSIDEIPTDIEIKYYDCELQPIFKLDSALLTLLLSEHFEENSSEDGSEWDKVQPLIEKHLNFDALNEDAPCLWYPHGKEKTIGYDEVISIAKENEWFS